jgi:hypothetical protein
MCEDVDVRGLKEYRDETRQDKTVRKRKRTEEDTVDVGVPGQCAKM